jgi:hypothetical protein
MIVNYDSSIVNKFGASFTDDARIVIYDCHMFIGIGHRLFENPGKLAAVI